MSSVPSLAVFAQCLAYVHDPRSKYGTYHPFQTILGIVFLGLLTARCGNSLCIEKSTVDRTITVSPSGELYPEITITPSADSQV